VFKLLDMVVERLLIFKLLESDRLRSFLPLVFAFVKSVSSCLMRGMYCVLSVPFKRLTNLKVFTSVSVCKALCRGTDCRQSLRHVGYMFRHALRNDPQGTLSYVGQVFGW
jgi:hypothetical protein